MFTSIDARVSPFLTLALAAALAVGLAGCGDNLECVGDECIEREDCNAVGDEDGDGSADCADSDCSAAPACQGALCGNLIINIGEGCDDGNQVDTDACTNTCQRARCGDGIAQTGVDQCDDGNTVDTDGCTNACTTARCGDGITGPNEQCDDGNMVDTDDCTNACRTRACGDGVVGPGEECDDMNMVDTDACTSACRNAVCGDMIVHAGVEECDDGNQVDTDGCTNACELSTCGDGVIQPGETCDDGDTSGGDGCGATCATEAGFVCNGVPSICMTVCGDGIVAGFEGCDQGNLVDGDGCSAVCQVEPGSACGGMPSVCAATCGNGALDASEQCDDGNLAAADGCSAICRFDIGCAAGETQVVATSSMPVAIADSATVTSSVMFTGNRIVSRMVAYLGDLTHTFDGDLDIALRGPRMVVRELTSDNGGAGQNYVRTFFDDGAVRPIQVGSAPFTGRFRPEQSLSAGGGFRGQIVGGTWTLAVTDDAPDDTGTLGSWSLIACTSLQVPRCGNGNVDAGEECDDGNEIGNDLCSNSCGRVDGCGDGDVDPGEACDDDNLVPGDGCNAACQTEAVCPAGQIAAATSSTTMTAIPDNDPAGAASTVLVAPAGGVASVRVLIRSLTHTNDADLDLYLEGPTGIRRELSTDNGGSGDSYINTMLEDLGLTAIDDTSPGSAAVPPFSGSFRPEQSLSTSAGVDLRRTRTQGAWTLRVFDDTATGTGSLDSWTLFVCVDPTGYCGDAIVNGGEECDDGNVNDLDGCSNTCVGP